MLKTICENSHEKKTGILSQFGLEQVRMMEYISKKSVDNLPRLPLEGSLDLTYRCNNNCRHCWLWIPPDSREAKKELSLDEIKGIVDEARSLGCRKWFISGGEPMLRPDFEEIFDYITINSVLYTLNTNGTLITPKIARLMKRKGSKLIALYGATADVHDHITRTPGSFEAFKRGIFCLKEAGVGFTIQIVPMKDNFHQYQKMIQLAESLSPDWRIGASWLYLSAYGDKEKNEEIKRQRLNPKQIARIDQPQISFDNLESRDGIPECSQLDNHTGLFASCIAKRNDFHVDPYGQMSFCCFVKDPNLRFHFKKGTFNQFWDRFLPSLKEKVKPNKEYQENCGSCEARENCRWCSVYGFLEHRNYYAKIEYLCDITNEKMKRQKKTDEIHRKFYSIAGMTIELNSDLPIKETTFKPKFKLFEAEGPGKDNIRISHHFSIPNLDGQDLGKEVYRIPPLAIYKKGHHWVYLGIYPFPNDTRINRVVVFNEDHTQGVFYHKDESLYKNGSLSSLTLFPSDLIHLSRLLADREGCCLHSSGIVFENKGLLFSGHSGAGKSTMIKLLKKKSKILCDDRMIIRKWRDGIRIHGTWSHGEIPIVSPDDSLLDAIFFIHQAKENRIEAIKSKKERIGKILSLVIKPLTTVDWWEQTISFVEILSEYVPCYNLYFDKSGKVMDLLTFFCRNTPTNSRMEIQD